MACTLQRFFNFFYKDGIKPIMVKYWRNVAFCLCVTNLFENFTLILFLWYWRTIRNMCSIHGAVWWDTISKLWYSNKHLTYYARYLIEMVRNIYRLLSPGISVATNLPLLYCPALWQLISLLRFVSLFYSYYHINPLRFTAILHSTIYFDWLWPND